MATLYSQSEWFVPTLKGFTDSKRTPTQICVWHKSKRASQKDGGNLVKCSLRIAAQDVARINHLVEGLRIVPAGGREYLENLRELSSLVLCKSVHRLANAPTIFKFWKEGLESPGPSRKTTNQHPKSSTQDPSVHRVTSSGALGQLGITVGSKTNCHGRGEKADVCGNWISKSNVARIVAISTELGPDWRLSDTVRNLLEELSGLIMCRRFHQDQASSKFKEWINIANSKSVLQNTPPIEQIQIPPRTPTKQPIRIGHAHSTVENYSDVETPETWKSSLWTSPRRSLSPVSNVTTPNNSLRKPRAIPSSPHIDGLPARNVGQRGENSCASPTPIARKTRSMTKANFSESRAPTEERLAAFEPLKTARSPTQAAGDLMEAMKKPLSQTEFKDGYIYGFRRPGCDLIKIGITNVTVAGRMKTIKSQCKYQPEIVFEIHTKNAMKVERLVHNHLYNQRRRERSCKGCSKSHIEWFEGVTDAYAMSVAQAWVRWIDLRPYNERGSLKDEWVQRTQNFQFDCPGDIWMEWNKITIANKVIKEEVQEEAVFDAEIKFEKVLDVLSKLGSQRGRSPAPRIKEYYSDVAAAVPSHAPEPILVQ